MPISSHGCSLWMASVHSSEINTAHESGFDGFIAKPIHFDRFHDLVQHILSAEQVSQTC
jgi:1-deoxy-D-xylulose 5-phosphate reductoisomerase